MYRKIFFSVCIFLGLGFVERSWAGSNLVAHYKFEGNFRDGIGNDQGIQGGQARIVYDTEKDSNVLDLDGIDSYLDCGKRSDFDITSAITVAAWIKVRSFDKDWQAIVSKGLIPTRELQIRVSVLTPTIWGWVGILIVLAVIAGLGMMFRILGRR